MIQLCSHKHIAGKSRESDYTILTAVFYHLLNDGLLSLACLLHSHHLSPSSDWGNVAPGEEQQPCNELPHFYLILADPLCTLSLRAK